MGEQEEPFTCIYALRSVQRRIVFIALTQSRGLANMFLRSKFGPKRNVNLLLLDSTIPHPPSKIYSLHFPLMITEASFSKKFFKSLRQLLPVIFFYFYSVNDFGECSPFHPLQVPVYLLNFLLPLITEGRAFYMTHMSALS